MVFRQGLLLAAAGGREELWPKIRLCLPAKRQHPTISSRNIGQLLGSQGSDHLADPRQHAKGKPRNPWIPLSAMPSEDEHLARERQRDLYWPPFVVDWVGAGSCRFAATDRHQLSSAKRISMMTKGKRAARRMTSGVS